MLPLGYGVATASYQVEGSLGVGGRGRCIWDELCARPGAIADGSDGSVACDSYARTDEDLDLVAGLGVGAYRFSIAWPRIQADGTGPALVAGLDHYDRLVDGLLARGLTAMPTLYHWDLPQALQEAGGWPARVTAERFAEYAALVAARLGDRVTTWATFNEPWCSAFLGYAAGVYAPGVRGGDAAFSAAHHLLLAHALGAEAVRAAAPDAQVGIVLNLAPVRLDDDGDPDAQDHVDAIQNRLWLDALARGSYPTRLTALADPGLVRAGDLERVQGSLDWVGLNYYSPYRIALHGPPRAGVGQDVDAYPGAPVFSFAPREPLTAMGWEVDATGLVEVLRTLADQLPGLPVRVTENGAAFDDQGRRDDGSVQDDDRIGYLRDHLAAVEQARSEGVPVVDYVAWTLMDNFEWAEGYLKTFGLVEVEPGTLRRVPKASYDWFGRYVRGERD
ncbi:MAG: broad-specificity cellobiase [Frankiales bacterium]|nr:broad-specificity cellobiase [Frankiales bacterium]